MWAATSSGRGLVGGWAAESGAVFHLTYSSPEARVSVGVVVLAFTPGADVGLEGLSDLEDVAIIDTFRKAHRVLASFATGVGIATLLRPFAFAISTAGDHSVTAGIIQRHPWTVANLGLIVA